MLPYHPRLLIKAEPWNSGTGALCMGALRSALNERQCACPNAARTLPERCPNDARTLPERCPNNVAHRHFRIHFHARTTGLRPLTPLYWSF